MFLAHIILFSFYLSDALDSGILIILYQSNLAPSPDPNWAQTKI